MVVSWLQALTKKKPQPGSGFSFDSRRVVQLGSGVLCTALFACSVGHKSLPYLSEAKPSAKPQTTDEAVVVVPVSSAGNGCDTFVELPVQRPNFYFVLDISGSMNEYVAGANGETRLAIARASIVDMLRTVGSRVNYGLTLFPQPSDVDACLPGAEVFPLTPGDDATAKGKDGPTLQRFLSRVLGFSARGGTPTSATLAEVRDRLKGVEGKSVVFLLTDGAPNCVLDAVCGTDMCIPNIEGQRLIDGTRCDANLNCCQPGYFPDLCLDGVGAADEVAKLRADGIPSYIIGLPGAGAYSSVLELMAERAGTARGAEASDAGAPVSIDPGTPRYYQVEDAPALAEALATLSQTLLADCALSLGVRAEHRENVHVFADDQELYADTDWEFRDDGKVLLLGTTCERWQSGAIARVHLRECQVQIF